VLGLLGLALSVIGSLLLFGVPLRGSLLVLTDVGRRLPWGQTCRSHCADLARFRAKPDCRPNRFGAGHRHGRNSNIAGIAQSYVSAIAAAFSQEWRAAHGLAAETVQVTTRAWHNPSLETR